MDCSITGQEARNSTLKPRIHVITLAVADLDRALAFYRDGLGFQTEGLIGTEYTGDRTTPDGTTAVFHLDGGLMLSIYPRSELAKDALVPLTAAKPGEFSIGHVVASRPEVDEVIAQARAPEQPSPTHLTTGPGASTRDTSKIPTATSGRSSGTQR
jgi:catechol 2,3-dioxygenase-like lactoylglutathione lyase family enzyme